VWDDLPPIVKKMHPSFENLTITGTLGLQASLMDIHHNTSLKTILEDVSISSTPSYHIRFCSSKGVGLWLVARPSIYLFCITHSTFISTLHFCLGLIQPLASNFFTCECGHMFDASGMHLARCSFGGQQIATHDAIWHIMYALARESGHVI
jgi:hypothetical protein